MGASWRRLGAQDGPSKLQVTPQNEPDRPEFSPGRTELLSGHTTWLPGHTELLPGDTELLLVSGKIIQNCLPDIEKSLNSIGKTFIFRFQIDLT